MAMRHKLKLGVQKHGTGNWKAIYDDNRVFAANHLEILDLEEEHKKMMTVSEVLKAAS